MPQNNQHDVPASRYSDNMGRLYRRLCLESITMAVDANIYENQSVLVIPPDEASHPYISSHVHISTKEARKALDRLIRQDR